MLKVILIVVLVKFSSADESPTDWDPNETWNIPMADGSFVEMNMFQAYMQYIAAKATNDDESDIVFYFYGRGSTDDNSSCTLSTLDRLKTFPFHRSTPTRIIIHGWMNDKESPLNLELRQIYSEPPYDYNVIIVDWSYVARNAFYVVPRFRVSEIGAKVSTLIDYMVTELQADLSLIGLIGHSLGAHVCGYAGRYTTTGPVAFIVGFDPAYPLFRYNSAGRLHKEDASTVVTLHTNAGILGFSQPIGHVAFYPNGGFHQPECGRNLFCSHGQAFMIYVKSLREGTRFTYYKCDEESLLVMYTPLPLIGLIPFLPQLSLKCPNLATDVSLKDPAHMDIINGAYTFYTSWDSHLPRVVQQQVRLSFVFAKGGDIICNPRNKVALQPGHSLMDWIRLGNSGEDLRGIGPIRPITIDELALHNSQNDAWTAIRGKVYNITRYMNFHPGGVEELMRAAGKDGTSLFEEVHAWVNYEQLMQKCLLGPLVHIDPFELGKLDNVF